MATAHKLARIIYFMLKNRSDYQDPGATYYQEQYRQRVVKNLKRKAQKLGFALVSAEAQVLKAGQLHPPSQLLLIDRGW